MQAGARSGRKEAAGPYPLAKLLACPPATSNLLNSSAQSIEFDGGETVFRQSGLCKGLYVIVAGTFLRKAERLEARFATVEVADSPSIFFRGMAGTQTPIAIAHGEGYADFSQTGDIDQALVAMRFVDHRGQATEGYPLNPNGSPRGITGLTSRDGRVTIMMPHPERVFRAVQNSWRPEEWNEDGAWMRMFRNARVWVN